MKFVTFIWNVGVSPTGRPPLSTRVIIGSLIIKHLYDLDSRETVEQIPENIYMQYFLDLLSFSSEPPFDASLFVDFCKRLGMKNLNAINERIISLKTRQRWSLWLKSMFSLTMASLFWTN